MSKKNGTSGITHARIRTHDGRRISAAFPADQHVATNPQREIPNPAAALADLGQPQPSERARMRAATVSQEQRDARARREALAFLEREDARRDAIAHGAAPTVSEELQAVRRRPIDAPMATRIGATAPTNRQWQFTVALAVWSAACFVLGTLA